MAFLSRSMVGDDQIAAPAGPDIWVPLLFTRVDWGGSGIAYVFQICFPVPVSSAATLPRNVQQGYLAFPPGISSMDETGTQSRPACSLGAPVTRANGCLSTGTFHTSMP